MTTTFGTNANNDLYIGSDGNLVVLTGLQAVMAACETATKAQLGEMVLTDTQGIPNFQTIWVGSPNYALYQSFLRNTLLAVPGVLDVKSITLTALNNILSYTAVIVTQFGDAELTNGL